MRRFALADAGRILGAVDLLLFERHVLIGILNQVMDLMDHERRINPNLVYTDMININQIYYDRTHANAYLKLAAVAYRLETARIMNRVLNESGLGDEV